MIKRILTIIFMILMLLVFVSCNYDDIVNTTEITTENTIDNIFITVTTNSQVQTSQTVESINDISTTTSATTNEYEINDVFEIKNLNIDFEENKISAIVTATKECKFLVRFIDENIFSDSNYPLNKEYIENGNIYAESVVAVGENQNISADLVGRFPANSIAEAVLIDENNKEISDSYTLAVAMPELHKAEVIFTLQKISVEQDFFRFILINNDTDELICEFGKIIDGQYGIYCADTRCVECKNNADLIPTDRFIGTYFKEANSDNAVMLEKNDMGFTWNTSSVKFSYALPDGNYTAKVYYSLHDGAVSDFSVENAAVKDNEDENIILKKGTLSFEKIKIKQYSGEYEECQLFVDLNKNSEYESPLKCIVIDDGIMSYREIHNLLHPDVKAQIVVYPQENRSETLGYVTGSMEINILTEFIDYYSIRANWMVD